MTNFQKIVKVGELPPEWAKAFPDADMQVCVEITEYDAELSQAQTSLDKMRIVSRRSAAKELTPAIVAEIVNKR